jgi:uncharacterized membrane protein YoaK (UPF0700 family)
MSATSRAASPLESCLLSSVGGCIDAIGLITLGGLFVSHMSGNTASLGAAFGQGHWSVGLPHLFAVPVFVLGLFFGYFWVGQSPRRCALVFLIEAVLLTLFGLGLWLNGGVHSDTVTYYVLASLPLLAMGLQNATLRQVGHSTYPSTYVTGVLDRLAKSAALWVSLRRTPDGAHHGRDALMSLGVWFAYVAGAIAGGAGTLFFHPLALVAPILILVILAVPLLREPETSAPA